jgi:chromosomal replication initiation ATPase DnaA
MDHHAIEGVRGRAVLARPFGARAQRLQAKAETRLFQAVEAAFAVRRDDLHAATRGRCDIAFARQTGMYLARVALGMTLSEAGHLFGRDRTTVSHACRIVEDLRDDPGFDALLHQMESFVLRPHARNGQARR